MSQVIQMPVPVVELAEGLPKVRLAYTRKDGWVVVCQFPDGDPIEWRARPGRKLVLEYDILAWAELPPVPESAA